MPTTSQWLNTGIVSGSFDKTHAEKNGVTIHMVFEVSKLDESTRPIFNLSDKKGLGFSINDLLHTNLCTVEYAQTKQVVQSVIVLGKNA